MTPTPFAVEPVLALVRERSTGIGSAIHGDRHWRTVAANGRWLVERTAGADPLVVLLFALFHDAMRENDSVDPGHGHRAAALAEQACADGVLRLESAQLDELLEACRYHADGLVSSSATIACCWDGDRLDLPRVGIVPSASLLSTTAAGGWSRPAGEPPGWVELADAAATARAPGQS